MKEALSILVDHAAAHDASDAEVEAARTEIVHVLKTSVANAQTDIRIHHRAANELLARPEYCGRLAELLTDMVGVERSAKGFSIGHSGGWYRSHLRRLFKWEASSRTATVGAGNSDDEGPAPWDDQP